MKLSSILPTIDLSTFIENGIDPMAINAIKQGFSEYGAVIIKDPRVSFDKNDHFLNMLEDYYNQDNQVKLKDARPTYGYQAGATPGNKEHPGCLRNPKCAQVFTQLSGENQATEWNNQPDPKWRFFWRIGTCHSIYFPHKQYEPVIPEHFQDQWASTMNEWGELLVQSGITVCKMLETGFEFQPGQLMQYCDSGNHLLAPTGSDLSNVETGNVLAAFHSDMNLITVHGKSRFPGLFIWTRDLQKVPVVLENGDLLMQAGKQLQMLTNDQVLAGYHEVIVTEKTLDARNRQFQLNRPLWRVSSTLFLHSHPDLYLKPLIGPVDETKEYVRAGQYLNDKLKRLGLLSEDVQDTQKSPKRQRRRIQ
eukprot:NODE_583_length_5729_cov_0.479574.p1 type:complete len:363 gc:universal NODE_583_length_5729_cov_0.479574:4894-3806(-)